MTLKGLGHANQKGDRLRQFVTRVGAILDTSAAEDETVRMVAQHMRELVRVDDWLPSQYTDGDPARYCQHLLHCDSQERFSVVSFVWMPGQATPVHDHGVWGVIGMLRGSELSQRYRISPDDGLIPAGMPMRLIPGDIEILSPLDGDIHQVRNGVEDGTSVSIHVYGGNIGQIRRHSFADNGLTKEFVSGYSNAFLPNIWG